MIIAKYRWQENAYASLDDNRQIPMATNAYASA